MSPPPTRPTHARPPERPRQRRTHCGTLTRRSTRVSTVSPHSHLLRPYRRGQLMRRGVQQRPRCPASGQHDPPPPQSRKSLGFCRRLTASTPKPTAPKLVSQSVFKCPTVVPFVDVYLLCAWVLNDGLGSLVPSCHGLGSSGWFCWSQLPRTAPVPAHVLPLASRFRIRSKCRVDIRTSAASPITPTSSTQSVQSHSSRPSLAVAGVKLGSQSRGLPSRRGWMRRSDHPPRGRAGIPSSRSRPRRRSRSQHWTQCSSSSRIAAQTPRSAWWGRFGVGWRTIPAMWISSCAPRPSPLRRLCLATRRLWCSSRATKSMACK
eukprot:m.330294 g.330294  ORF g.330294 m.330294 type:complete len:319 (-) comp27719_c0_seq14:979-1935(-)